VDPTIPESVFPTNLKDTCVLRISCQCTIAYLEGKQVDGSLFPAGGKREVDPDFWFSFLESDGCRWAESEFLRMQWDFTECEAKGL
jgi:hypothetical protein